MMSVLSFSHLTLPFFPRDAMHKRGLCRHAVSACVCLSVRHVHGLCQNE